MLQYPSFSAGALASRSEFFPAASAPDMGTPQAPDWEAGLRRLAWISWIFLSAVDGFLDTEHPRFDFAKRSLLRLCDVFERNRSSFSDAEEAVARGDACDRAFARDISVLAERSKELCDGVDRAIAAEHGPGGTVSEDLEALRLDAAMLLDAYSAIVRTGANG